MKIMSADFGRDVQITEEHQEKHGLLFVDRKTNRSYDLCVLQNQ